MAKFIFCILLDFLEVLFFPGCLCRDTSSLAARPHALKLVFGPFSELMRGRLVASLAFCLPRRSRGQWEKNDTNIQLSWPKKLCQVMDLFYGQIIVVLIDNSLSCRYLVFYEKAGSPTKTLIYIIFSLILPSIFCVNAKRSHGPLRDTIARSRVFCSPNTLEMRHLGTKQFI